MPRSTSKHPLANYRAKRNFDVTSEPDGEVAKSAHRSRFVVHKHDARRLHFDLRLEFDGVFKSWAVTRGPSNDPADKRLAVEVEYHPLAYGDFEGTIPAGEYGGGTVQLWDRGYWTVEGARPAMEAFEAGDLKFSLDGTHLHGSWVLVRMKHDRTGGRRSNWLLIKHRDKFAVPGGAQALLATDASVASGRTLATIAAGSGPSPVPFIRHKRQAARATSVRAATAVRASAAPRTTASTRTSATKRTSAAKRASATIRIPAFVEPQLCKLVDDPPTQAGWVHEVKLDGYRAELRVHRGVARFRTRKGLDWTERFGSLGAAARSLPDCLIDGEVVAMDTSHAPSFSALQDALSSGNGQALRYFAFDLLFAEGHDLRTLPLRERKRALEDLLARNADSDIIRYVEHFDRPARDVLESACALGMEGIVCKRADSPYHSGRGGDWLKVKCRNGQEVVLGGWTHQGGSVRSLLAGVHRGDTLVYVGRIGTGYGRDVVGRLMPRLEALTTTRSPFGGSNAPAHDHNIRWLEPKLVAEIGFAGWTASGMIRQASFKGLREDKPAGEVMAETKSRAQPRPRSVRLTHPDKVLWPDAKDGRAVTKQDLATYYRDVADWLLPHLVGRPCSLVRAPEGIGGQHFFQRHAMAGLAKTFKLVKVKGDKAPYVQIDDLDALDALAQMAVVEIHPWNCVPHRPDFAGRLVFDLDPAPDVAFSAVIDAALEIRERLRRLGLESYCKTTGGKGLHVVAPLDEANREVIEWPAAKNFAHLVCSQMASDHPDRYIDTMSKARRVGKIFLDYLRNDRTSTAVAPLSPRARAGAPVSMPIAWRDLNASLDPTAFTVRTVPAKIRRSNAWKDYEKSAGSLRAAIEKLTQPAVKKVAKKASKRAAKKT